MAAQNTQYLASKILTAPPYRLHLILIEGAIRFARQAADALHRGDRAAAAAPLLRVIDIVGEMLAGVRKQETEVNRRLTDLYWFLFRLASEAKIHSDGERLAVLLRLLEYERQTWQMLCDKLGGTNNAAATQSRPGLALEA